MLHRPEKSRTRSQKRSSHDQQSSSSSPERAEPWSRSGEGFARGLRYLACVGAGYLFGVAVGGASDPIPLPFLLIIGAVGLWLIFGRGRSSVAHAAADAVATANARASAAAVASTQVTVAGGHVVNGPMPPIEAYERDVWAGVEHERLPAGARYMGDDAITGEPVFSLPGERGVLRMSELQRRQRHPQVQLNPDGSASFYDSGWVE